MIDVGKHRGISSELSSCADAVQSVAHTVRAYIRELQLVWNSAEVNDALEEANSIARALDSVEGNLRGTGPSIVSAAEAVRERQEEEEREREEEEERKKQEEEAAASGGTT